MHIELNDNEAKVLTGLLDIAVKAGGLQVAEAAIALAKKVVMAAQAEAQTKTPQPDAAALSTITDAPATA